LTVRIALNDAAPLYRDAPEAQAVSAASQATLAQFMQEALPNASASVRALAGELLTTTLSAVGKEFSESLRTPAEIQARSDALADMLCAYLRSLAVA
jgi:hypothetical protein